MASQELNELKAHASPVNKLLPPLICRSLSSWESILQGIATEAESWGRDESNVDEGTKSGFGGVTSFSPTHPGPNFTPGGYALKLGICGDQNLKENQ